MPEENGSDRRDKNKILIVFWSLIGLAIVLLAGSYWLTHSGKTSTIVPGKALAATGGIIPPAQRTPLAAFKLTPVGGGAPLKPAGIKGKVVVLHFWATWCPPCRAEFPEFAKYDASQKGNADLVVAPVSIDDSPKPVPPFVKKTGEEITVYWDNGALANEMGVNAIPETILVDKKGRVAYEGIGAQSWGPGGVPEMVKALLGES